jgi:hypothetical protein
MTIQHDVNGREFFVFRHLISRITPVVMLEYSQYNKTKIHIDYI